MLTMVLSSSLGAANTIYAQTPMAKERPLKGFVQLVQIAVWVVGGVMIIAAILNRSPLLLLSGFGAMTAILLLVFRDTILSLVASVQLTAQDMVRVGDWIEMPQFGADGDVVDVQLHTVKVQNWDKTITTIPTHRLISDSFKNWRGMSQAGGRRIKRSVWIDVSSIRFCDDAMIERFRGIELIRDYVRDKLAEVEEDNTRRGVDTSLAVNGRRMTNIGTFRAYLIAYLRAHPQVHGKMTFLVRQLQPTERGLPVEVYVFSRDQEWASYESIQADIFDHVLAAAREFDLRIAQDLGGGDLQDAASQMGRAVRAEASA